MSWWKARLAACSIFCSSAVSGLWIEWNKKMDEYLFPEILLDDIQKELMWLIQMHVAKQDFYNEIKAKEK